MSRDVGFPSEHFGLINFTDEQIRNMQLNICRSARDAEDAEMLMDVLGVHPKQRDPMSPDQRESANKKKRQELVVSIRRKRKAGEPLSSEELDFIEKDIVRSA